jgi:hypothetical protein
LWPFDQRLRGFRGHVPSEADRTTAVNARAVVARERAAQVFPVIRGIMAAGITSLSGIARELTRQGIPTPRGAGAWQVTLAWITNLLWIYPTLPTPYPLRGHVRHIHRRLVTDGSGQGRTARSRSPGRCRREGRFTAGDPAAYPRPPPGARGGQGRGPGPEAYRIALDPHAARVPEPGTGPNGTGDPYAAVYRTAVSIAYTRVRRAGFA